MKDPSISSQALDKSICHGASVVIRMYKSDTYWQRADDMQLEDDVTLDIPNLIVGSVLLYLCEWIIYPDNGDVMPDARIWSSSALAPSMTFGNPLVREKGRGRWHKRVAGQNNPEWLSTVIDWDETMPAIVAIDHPTKLHQHASIATSGDVKAPNNIDIWHIKLIGRR